MYFFHFFHFKMDYIEKTYICAVLTDNSNDQLFLKFFSQLVKKFLKSAIVQAFSVRLI